MRWLVLCSALVGCGGAPPAAPLPPVMVWAWDRAEDLRFLGERRDVGVAYLAATLHVGEHVRVQRRHGSLRVPPQTPLEPVVRVEVERDAPLDAPQRRAMLEAIRAEAALAGQGRLQLDFEATASQRAAYTQLLVALRAALGPRYRISVTALASWCLGDRWMASLPVDEVVPMFYRMGAEARGLRDAFAAGEDLAPECRRAHGLITDEPAVGPPSPRRLYLFAPSPWRPALLARELGALGGRS